MTLIKSSFVCLAGACVAVALMLVTQTQGGNSSSGPCGTNCITSIIWQAKLKGQVGAQSFNIGVNPFMAKKKLTETTFLTSVLGRAPQPSEVLAVNFVLDPQGTNIHLLVYNTLSRTPVTGITFNEDSTLLLDGQRGIFTSSMPVGFTSITLQGGRLHLGGQVQEQRNVPTRVKATVQGFLIAPPSSQPPFGNAITGLVLRATITTKSPPLEVVPPVIPNP